MKPGEYNFVTGRESRRLASFGRPRGLIVVPKHLFPPPEAVQRHRQSCLVPLHDPDRLLVVEWTSGSREDAEPELHQVDW